MSSLNADVPEQLVRIVRKAMDKNPGARYRDSDQLLQILVNFRDQMRLSTSQPSQPRPMPPPGQSQPSAPSQGVAPAAPPARQEPQRPATPASAPAPAAYPVPPQRPFSGSTPPPMPIRPSMPPQSDVLTQRYSPAPEAPGSPLMQNVGSVRPQTPRMVQPASSLTPPPQPPVDPNFYNSRSMRPLQQFHEPRPLWDPVTITLAVLAVIAIACLVPLYVAALGARAG